MIFFQTKLELGFPRKISGEWYTNGWFEVVMKKKGTFVDGHEYNDVVEYRKKFLR